MEEEGGSRGGSRGGGGSHSTRFYMRRLCPEVQPVTLLYTIFDRINWTWEGGEQIQQVTTAGFKPIGLWNCESSAMTTQPRCLLKVVLNSVRVKPNDLWIASTLHSRLLSYFTSGLVHVYWGLTYKYWICQEYFPDSKDSLQRVTPAYTFCTEMFWRIWFLASQNS